MTVPRFFIASHISEGASRITVHDRIIAHQVKNVLRKKEGGEILILDGSGFEYLCVIAELSSGSLELDVMEKKRNDHEPARRITLYQSIIKKDKMEWVFEKCTEIGVSEFAPVLAEHSVKLRINMERSAKIIREAAEQSRRGRIPSLTEALRFSGAVARAASDKNALNICAHNEGGFAHIKDIVASDENFSRPVNIFIGPEGGFSEEEIQSAREHDFTFVSLGVTTLRSETAAIAASLFTVV